MIKLCTLLIQPNKILHLGYMLSLPYKRKLTCSLHQLFYDTHLMDSLEHYDVLACYRKDLQRVFESLDYQHKALVQEKRRFAEILTSHH